MINLEFTASMFDENEYTATNKATSEKIGMVTKISETEWKVKYVDSPCDYEVMSLAMAEKLLVNYKSPKKKKKNVDPNQKTLIQLL